MSASEKYHKYGLSQYSSYEEYLQNIVTPEDVFFLGSPQLATKLVLLGALGSTGHSTGAPTLTQSEYDNIIQQHNIERLKSMETRPKTLASSGIDLSHSRFLRELSLREDLCLRGRISVIIYLRLKYNNSEIAGYIDFKHRLRTEGHDMWKLYYSGEKKITPLPSDLSYFNFTSGKSKTNNSEVFSVIHDFNTLSLTFRESRDFHVINVSLPDEELGDGTKRIIVEDPQYLEIQIYEHSIRYR